MSALEQLCQQYTTQFRQAQKLARTGAERGSRYAAKVVDLFDDADFCAATAAMLEQRRADLYVEIYSARPA